MKALTQELKSLSFSVTLCHGDELVSASGGFDDSFDDSTASSRLREPTAFNCAGKMSDIVPVKLQAALIRGFDVQQFTFSRSLTSSRTALELSSAPLVLVNVTYLVADADPAVEDLLNELPSYTTSAWTPRRYSKTVVMFSTVPTAPLLVRQTLAHVTLRVVD